MGVVSPFVATIRTTWGLSSFCLLGVANSAALVTRTSPRALSPVDSVVGTLSSMNSTFFVPNCELNHQTRSLMN